MDSYLIAYRLNDPEKDYSDLLDKIKEEYDTWYILDSTWLIKSNLNANQIRDSLKPYIDSNDKLLVVRLSGEGAWVGFSSQASDWLESNL